MSILKRFTCFKLEMIYEKMRSKVQLVIIWFTISIQEQVVLHDVVHIDDVYRRAHRTEGQLKLNHVSLGQFPTRFHKFCQKTQANGKLHNPSSPAQSFKLNQFNEGQTNKEKGVLGSKPPRFNCFKSGTWTSSAKCPRMCNQI